MKQIKIALPLCLALSLVACGGGDLTIDLPPGGGIRSSFNFLRTKPSSIGCRFASPVAAVLTPEASRIVLTG